MIWSRLGTTQQYYPVLHSAFWLEHRVLGRLRRWIPLGQRDTSCDVSVPLRPRAGTHPALKAQECPVRNGSPLRSSRCTPSVPSQWLGFPSRRIRSRWRSTCWQPSLTSRFDRGRGCGWYLLGLGLFARRAAEQISDGDAARGAPFGDHPSSREDIAAARCGPAASLVRHRHFLRAVHGLGGTDLHRGKRQGLWPGYRREVPPCRAGGLVLSGQARLAAQPDLHLPPVARGAECAMEPRHPCRARGGGGTVGRPQVEPRSARRVPLFRRLALPGAGVPERLPIPILLRGGPFPIHAMPWDYRARR